MIVHCSQLRHGAVDLSVEESRKDLRPNHGYLLTYSNDSIANFHVPVGYSYRNYNGCTAAHRSVYISHKERHLRMLPPQTIDISASSVLAVRRKRCHQTHHRQRD